MFLLSAEKAINNQNLPTCAAQNMADHFTENGWSGQANIRNNDILQE